MNIVDFPLILSVMFLFLLWAMGETKSKVICDINRKRRIDRRGKNKTTRLPSSVTFTLSVFTNKHTLIKM